MYLAKFYNWHLSALESLLQLGISKGIPPIITLNSEKLILPSPFLSTVWIISSISLYVTLPGRCINTNFISSAGIHPVNKTKSEDKYRWLSKITRFLRMIFYLGIENCWCWIVFVNLERLSLSYKRHIKSRKVVK